MFESQNGEVHNFNTFYKFHHFLGTGSFGFVVKAEKADTGEILALKVSSYLF
jgi:hypothetical protein